MRYSAIVLLSPVSFDGGNTRLDQIAILDRFVPINFAGGTNFVDAATGWCWPDRVRKELDLSRLAVTPHFFRIGNVPIAPQLNMAVGKSGRTTQLTRGTIIDIGATDQCELRRWTRGTLQRPNRDPWSCVVRSSVVAVIRARRSGLGTVLADQWDYSLRAVEA